MKKFYSIEYIDDEGDKNIKHALLDSESVLKICEEFAQRGIIAAVYDLSPPSDETNNLESGDSLEKFLTTGVIQ